MDARSQSGKRQAVLAALHLQPEGPLLERLCSVAQSVIPCDAVAVVLEAGGRPNGVIASCGDLGQQFADLEFSVGEGPSFVVLDERRPELAPNLAATTPLRWPVLAEQLRALGVCSAFAFPLHIGAIRLGVLTLLRTTAGNIDEAGYQCALAIGQLVTDALLYLQSGLSDHDFEGLLATSEADRVRIHQATGMVAELVKCTIVDALALLRARAFRMGITLLELANLVVTQRSWPES